jgi:hypothetical protein|tara:strand:- start:4697 stop:4939 length:243 start_codon:yes stop_codon:yes gene_type:complete
VIEILSWDGNDNPVRVVYDPIKKQGGIGGWTCFRVKDHKRVPIPGRIMEQRTREDVDRIKRERREANKQLVKQKRRMKSE